MADAATGLGGAAAAGAPPLLEVENLRKHYPVGRGLIPALLGRAPKALRAVDGISFSIGRGETLGIVGESGCGKSTAGLAILQLVPGVAGDVRFRGRSIVGLPAAENRQLRRHMQIVLQNPYSSLNPRMKVGEIVAEPLRNFAVGDRAGRRDAAYELLGHVGLSRSHADRYPHEFSGGQRQRICIARALALSPALIVADEPVSALDVSVQAQILNLLLRIKEEFGLTYLFISHDLSVVRYLSDRIAVMYLGQIMEIGPADAVYEAPRHPYTQALMSAIPEPEMRPGARLTVLSGELPSAIDPPPGCPFQTRCPAVQERCRIEKPALRRLAPSHDVMCHFA